MSRRGAQRAAVAEHGAEVLRAARDELARADAKATTLFAGACVVVGTVLSGLVGGQWSPARIPVGVAQWTWWVGAAVVGAALVCLAAAMYPRTRRRGRSTGGVGYFGDVTGLTPGELRRALTGVGAPRATAVDQLRELARIINRKYALIKIAFVLLGLAAALCLVSVLLGAPVP